MNDKSDIIVPWHEMTGPILNWQHTDEEAQMVAGIVEKAYGIFADLVREGRIAKPESVLNPFVMRMDLVAVHCNQCPLDFRLMLYGPIEDMFADLTTIVRTIDRKTGRIPDANLLRCRKVVS